MRIELRQLYLIVVFLVIALVSNANGIKTIDSLVNAYDNKISRLDSSFFALYRKSLRDIPSSQLPSKLTYTEQGIQLSKKAKDKYFEARFVFDLAQVYGSIDSIETAKKYCKYAQSIAPDKIYRRVVAGWTAIYASISGDYQMAVEYYLKEIKICEETGQEEFKNAPLSNLAELLLSLEQYQEAKKYAQASANLDNSPKNIAYTSTLLGRVYQNLNQIDSAEYYYNLSLSAARKQYPLANEEAVYDRNHAFYHLSRFHREMGNPKLALIYADSSLLYIEKVSSQQFEFSIQAYSNYAQINLDLDRLEAAQKAISNIDDKVLKGKVSYDLGRLYYSYKINYAKAINDYKSALEYTNTLQNLRNKIEKQNADAFVSLLQKKTSSENISHFEEEIKTLRSTNQRLWMLIGILGILLGVFIVLYFLKNTKR